MDPSGPDLVLVLVTEFLTAFFLILGYLIRYRRRLDYVRGYDPSRIKDRDGLAHLIGGNLLVLGGYGTLTLFLELFYPDFAVLSFVTLLGLIPVMGMITAWRARKFEKV